MIEFNAMSKMEYPFQIDQPMINGEYFFKYVDHYNSVLEKLGFYSDTPNVDGTSAMSLYSKTKNKRYFRFVHQLFKTAVLYSVDKFSDVQWKIIENVCFKYSYFPRFFFKQVQKKSINKFVINSEAGVANLFNFISESYSVKELSNFEIAIDESNFKNSSKVKEKSPGVYSKLLEVKYEREF